MLKKRFARVWNEERPAGKVSWKAAPDRRLRSCPEWGRGRQDADVEVHLQLPDHEEAGRDARGAEVTSDTSMSVEFFCNDPKSGQEYKCMHLINPGY
jgi:hypothetical protein